MWKSLTSSSSSAKSSSECVSQNSASSSILLNTGIRLWVCFLAADFEFSFAILHMLDVRVLRHPALLPTRRHCFLSLRLRQRGSDHRPFVPPVYSVLRQHVSRMRCCEIPGKPPG